MPSAVRYATLDVARALAVTGVVFHHVLDGLVNAELLGANNALLSLNAALSMMRMPALAFLLGLFLPGGVSKYGLGGYLRHRGVNVLWTYLVWFVILTALDFATSGVKNTPRHLETLLLPWWMPGHLWFLPFAGVSAVIVGVLAPWRGPLRAAWTMLLLVVVSLALWGWSSELFGMTGLALLAFSAAGALVGRDRLGASLTGNPVGWMISGAVGAGAFVALLRLEPFPGAGRYLGEVPLTFGQRVLGLGTSVVGVVVLLGLAVVLTAAARLRGWLSYCGRRTLQIYLPHTVATGGTRILLLRLGVDSVFVHLVLGLVAGIFAPLLLDRVAGRYRLGWLFAPPARLLGASKPTTVEAIAGPGEP